MIVAAPLASRFAERFGTKLVVATGWCIVAVGARRSWPTSTVDTGYATGGRRHDAPRRRAWALAMAPATESIMGSLPRAKAGVGSAMNDTTRQMGGALGVAILGSILASSYGNAMEPVVSGLPPEAAEIAGDSIGGAAASRVPGRGDRRGAHGCCERCLHRRDGDRGVGCRRRRLVGSGGHLPVAAGPGQRCGGRATGRRAARPGSQLTAQSSDARPRGRPRDASASPAIMDAALQLVEEVGLGALSIDAIAARAGVSKATIYRRWSSKEELVVDAVVSLVSAVQPTMTGDLRKDLVTTLRRLRAFMSEFRGGSIFPWLVGEVASGSELGRRYAETVILPRRQALASMITLAKDGGELRPDLDVEVAVDMFTGPVILRKLFGPMLSEDQAWEEKVVDALLRGWRADIT